MKQARVVVVLALVIGILGLAAGCVYPSSPQYGGGCGAGCKCAPDRNCCEGCRAGTGCVCPPGSRPGI